MTKEPAESLDNLDGPVSLETPVCLEIKEKEVILLLFLIMRGDEDADVTDELINVNFKFVLCLTKACQERRESEDKQELVSEVREVRLGPQVGEPTPDQLWMLHLYMSRPLLHVGQEHLFFINLF